MSTYYKPQLSSDANGNICWMPSKMLLDMSHTISSARYVPKSSISSSLNETEAIQHVMNSLAKSQVARIKFKFRTNDMYARFILDMYRTMHDRPIIVVSPVILNTGPNRLTSVLKEHVEITEMPDVGVRKNFKVPIHDELTLTYPSISVFTYYEFLEIISTGTHFNKIATLIFFANESSRSVDSIVRSSHVLSDRVCIVDM